MKIGLKWVSLLAFLAVPALPATVQEAQDQLKTFRQNIQEEKKDLQAVRQRIRQKKKALTKKRQRERSILFEIQRIGKKLEEVEERHHDNQENLRLVRRRIANLRYNMQITESEMRRLHGFLAARLRMIYRERQSGFWRILASSQSLSQALSRLKFFHIIAAQNAHLIKRLTRQQRRFIDQTQKLLVQQQKSEELEQASIKSLGRIKSTRLERQKILNRVQRERAAHEKALQELNKASQRLSTLIQKLEQRANKLRSKITHSGRIFAKRKRILPWPTRGRVVTYFGKKRHQRFNTYIYNKGIDIKGTIGQNIFSVCKGHVLFAEWFEGYGRMIILDHGGGYNTVYAHLQKILVSEGDEVAEGQTIGKLGDSGTWKGPALYFEIRRRGEALNPLKWLER